jgi:hypothetical protein
MTLYQVTQTTDNGNGDTVGTLSYAILQANRNAGTDAIEFKSNIRITSVMKTLLNSDIVVIGNGKTVSGDANNDGITDKGDLRPFFILSGNVKFSDLTITNSTAKGGDANTGGGGAGMGGGMFIYDGNVSLNNVTFSNNQAQGGNGSILLSSPTGGGGMFGNSKAGGGGLFGDSTGVDMVAMGTTAAELALTTPPKVASAAARTAATAASAAAAERATATAAVVLVWEVLFLCVVANSLSIPSI